MSLPNHTLTVYDHPEPHSHRWSDLELESIKRYAEAYALQAVEALTQALATTERKGPLSKDQIREVFLAHGFTVKDGQTDLKPYVYDAAYALIALVQPVTERKLAAAPDHNGAPVPASPADMQVYDKIAAGYWTERKGEPVAWAVMNGLSKYQVCGSKKSADALCAEMQKRHDLSGSFAAFNVQPLYTSPQVPEDVIAILDECRTALIECDRDCDYELIDRAYAAIDAARKEPRQ